MAPSDANHVPRSMMNPQSFRLPPWCRLAAAVTGLLCCATAWATADGPDHYRVQGVTAAEGLPLHGKPKAKSAILGRIPADAQCLRNLGCSGGLSLEEFSSLGEAEKQQRLARHPRWCKVEHQGVTGWVEGRFLAEAACATGGVAAGNPGRPVVAISGDGGFGWCLQELSTARKYNLGLVTVVFADGHFGNVRGMLNQQFGQAYETELANPDFMTLAKAFGVPATRVTSPEALEGALKSAIAAGGPHLIEVPVGQMPSPWSLLRLRNQGAGADPTAPAVRGVTA